MPVSRLSHSEMTETGEYMYLSNAQATEEVRLVVENILRYHPDPFHVTSREAFFSVIDELLDRKGEISIGHHFFALARVASLIFDTHTQIHVSEDTPGFYTSFPLRFRIFPDGLYVIAGSEAYRDGIGKRVVSISGLDPDDVLNKLAHYASSDHMPRKRVFAEVFLYMPETYDAFDLKASNGQIELELEDLKSKRSTLKLATTWEKGYADFSWDRLNPFIPGELSTVHDVMGTEVPLYQKNLNDNYWYGFLDDERKYMYLQINKQFDKEDVHSAEFHLEWTRALWESNANVVIVDLRNDPGGMTNVGSGIPKFLENVFYTRSTLNGVAVLVGLDTVSAGTMLAAELEAAVAPIMIGQPTGSSPNMYLDAEKMVLPYSKMQLEVSKSAYISMYEADPRAYIAPDIPMAISFEDYVNGRDPLIETAKTIDKAVMEKSYRGASYNTPWKRASQEKARR